MKPLWRTIRIKTQTAISSMPEERARFHAKQAVRWRKLGDEIAA